MKLQYLGFIPFIVLYGWSLYYLKNTKYEEIPTVLDIIVIVAAASGTVLLVIGGVMWGLS